MTRASEKPALLLIEFNELSPVLLTEFIARGLLPSFKALYEDSVVFVTDAGERGLNLNPWVQWPTVHSGLPFAEHQVFNLGEGRALKRKSLADLLSEAGIRCGVFMSMNTNYTRLNGYFLPDPWDKDGLAHPEWLQPYYQLVSRQVQDSSREGSASKRELVQFALAAYRMGLSARTAAGLAGQLLAEKRNDGIRWKRAALFDRLQYDVFRRLNRRLNVRFASFFSNSTAHFQHYYWRHMEPERFPVPPSGGEDPSLREAILFGYQSMDSLIRQLLRDFPDAVIVLCTALSQEPWRETTKCTYRPKDWQAFLDFAALPLARSAIKPVMAEEFHLECPDEETASAVEARLRALSVAGKRLMTFSRTRSSVLAACGINHQIETDAIVVRETDGTAVPFGNLFTMIHSMRSGHHHPDGALWVRTGRHRVVDGKVPLTDIAPTILKHFGVPTPEYMRGKPLPIGDPAESNYSQIA